MYRKKTFTGYMQYTLFEEMIKGPKFDDCDMANIPYLFKKKKKRDFWNDNEIPVKVVVTVEELH